MSKTTPVRTPPEPITVIRQHTIAKLGPRARGRLTYQVGVGESGLVYLAVTANEGGGYFSREWVALPTLVDLLSPFRASGDVVVTAILRGAYANRSVNNAGFLAAVLRHEGLLLAAEPPHWHRCSDTWEAWTAAQGRDPSAPAADALESAPDTDPMPEPNPPAARTSRRGRPRHAVAP